MTSIEKVLSRALRQAEQISAREGLESPRIHAVVVIGDDDFAREKLRVDEGIYVDIVSESIFIAPGTLDNIVYRLLAGYFALALLNTFNKLDKERALLLARRYFFKVFVDAVKEA